MRLARVEVTGQRQCWRADGTPIDDINSPDAQGQDGSVQAGIPYPRSGRFRINSNGTVTDRLTRLIWLQDANAFGALQWDEALEAVRTRTAGGADDWRLPNVKELQSLVDFGFHYPAVPNAAGSSKCTDGNPFVGLAGGRVYWSSTTSTGDFLIGHPDDHPPPLDKAWGVDLDTGSTTPKFRTGERDRVATKFHVLPVRGPDPADAVRPAGVEVTGKTECWDGERLTGCGRSVAEGQDGAIEEGVPYPNPRFRDGGDGTVTDRLTGLIWLKDANPFATKTWQEALNAVNGLNVGGAEDWRLPNVKELQSLIDFGRANLETRSLATPRSSVPPLALPCGHPFDFVKSRVYWSSTTVVSRPEEAWFVSLRFGTTHFSGSADSATKAEKRGVWAVRGGRTRKR